ncbi:hypothetical protein BOTCAL_0114g00240 [Botryotinia calthae]|uniref:Uncharacterized protein n=1 Tax=Botryotinia calthae TaxID=38488 RepID=A0A4Y8D509_9HELO|nr:hypothetical protein BOTCAL_0114g00240 [Botryotinia calthae]
MPTEDIREESDFDEYTINASEAMQHQNLKRAEGTQSCRSPSYGVHVRNDEVSDGADSDIEDPLELQEVERRNSFCEDCNESVDGGLALHRESTPCPTLPGNERSSSSNNNCVTPRVEQQRHNVACSRHDSRTNRSKSGSLNSLGSPEFPMDEAIPGDQMISYSPDKLYSHLSNKCNDNGDDESEDHQVSSIASRYFTPYNGCEPEDVEESNSKINKDGGTEEERGASVGLGTTEKTGKEIEIDVDESSGDMNIDKYHESEVDENEISQIASDEGFPTASQHSKQYEKGHRLLHKYGTPSPSICAASKKNN